MSIGWSDETNHEKATGAPEYVGAFDITPDQINQLAANFVRIFEGLGGYITDAMRNRSKAWEEAEVRKSERR
jgi:hypothetical protein